MSQYKWGRTLSSLLAALLCALASIAVPAVAQDQPKRGGTLVYGINSGDPPTYDCHTSTLFPIIHLLSPHYSNLLRIDLKNYPKVVGDLAESWTVAPDASTYTFRLRAGVKFHDGSPFSAEDVKATYDRLRNPPQGVVSVRQGLVADIDTIETPDPLTVTFRLKRPNRALLYAFANPFNCVYSAAKLKENPSFPARNVMGTGAFQIHRARCRLALEGRALQGLLQAGPALSRRLPRHLHARRRPHQRPAGRADHGRLPQRDDGGPRPAGRRARQQDHRAGKPLAQLAADHVQHQEEAVRRRARAPRAFARRRPLEGGRGAAALHHHALCRRLSAARLRAGRARGRSGQDAGLLQGYRGVARRGAAAAGGSRRAQSQGQAHQPHHRQPVHRRRRLRHRPVAPDRRGNRAFPGQRSALQQRAERGRLSTSRSPSRAIPSTSRPTSSPATCRSISPPTRASTSIARSTSCSSCSAMPPTTRRATRPCASSRRACLPRPTTCPCCGGSASSS